MRTEYNAVVDGSFTSLPFGDGYTVASGEDIDPRHFAMLDQDVNDNDHAMYREYSSMTGRWMSPDPYSGSYNIDNPQSFNRYAYVLNSPMSYVDPFGLFDVAEGGCILDVEPSYVDGAFAGYFIWGIVSCSSPGGSEDPGGPSTTAEYPYADAGHPGGGGAGAGPAAPNNQMQTCTVNAHGVENNLPTRAPNHNGAYGVPETPGTAAIDRSQWLPPGYSNWTPGQRNAYINQYRNRISGYIPIGSGGYIQVFNGVSDNMGPPSGVTLLENDYPGRVLFELPGGQDLGNVNGMQFRIPSSMSCPHS